MNNVVNPLIFRAKYFPYYKNEIDVFYNHKRSIYLLLLTKRFYQYINTKKVITGNVYNGLKKCVFFNISKIEEQFKINWKKLLSDKSLKFISSNTFCIKIILFKPYDLFNIVEFTICYIIKQLFNFKINLRKTLTRIMFLLINEYNLIGVKCILSGRIKGVQRAKKEVFKLGESSVVHGSKRIKYCSSYIVTKYGKLGIKLWLFL